MQKGGHIAFIVLICVFFIIGLPMWLVGCNPNVENGCLTRDLLPGNVTDYNIQSGVCCSSCKCGKSTCCCGGYSCYSASLGINSFDGHCDASLNGIYYTQSDAENTGYFIGQILQILIDPRTKVCTIYIAEGKNVWIAGIFFMAFAACCCFCWACCWKCSANNVTSGVTTNESATTTSNELPTSIELHTDLPEPSQQRPSVTNDTNSYPSYSQQPTSNNNYPYGMTSQPYNQTPIISSSDPYISPYGQSMSSQPYNQTTTITSSNDPYGQPTSSQPYIPTTASTTSSYNSPYVEYRPDSQTTTTIGVVDVDVDVDAPPPYSE